MKSEKNILFVLTASAVVIILVTVLTLFSGKEGAEKKKPMNPTPTAQPVQTVDSGKTVPAMIKAVDPEVGAISLYRLDEKESITLSYQTAADIRDKYGSLTYATSLKYGDIVQVSYDKNNEMISLKKSADLWEFRGVEEFTISDTKLTVNGVSYRITDRTVFYCEEEEIAPGEVKEIDRINVCGKDSEVYSVCVTKGHGSIKLVNSESYQGAKVTFGDETHTLDGEPSYLVREGSYHVVVTGDKDAALIDVTVARNEQKVIDLYEYGGKPVEYSTVRFHITPFSAVLTVDGETMDYFEQDLTLAYGEHKVTVALGGYRSYQGYITLSKGYQSFRIDLVENASSGTGDGQTGGDEIGGGTSDGNETGDGQTGGETSSGSETGGSETGGEDSGTEPGTETGDGGNNGSQTGETGENGGTSGSGDTPVEDRDVFGIGEALADALGLTCDKSQYTRISKPENTKVMIQGISIGVTPLRFEKLIGTYTITLVKDGVEKEYTVTVADDGEPVDWRFPELN